MANEARGIQISLEKVIYKTWLQVTTEKIFLLMHNPQNTCNSKEKIKGSQMH